MGIVVVTILYGSMHVFHDSLVGRTRCQDIMQELYLHYLHQSPKVCLIKDRDRKYSMRCIEH